MIPCSVLIILSSVEELATRTEKQMHKYYVTFIDSIQVLENAFVMEKHVTVHSSITLSGERLMAEHLPITLNTSFSTA